MENNFIVHITHSHYTALLVISDQMKLSIEEHIKIDNLKANIKPFDKATIIKHLNINPDLYIGYDQDETSTELTHFIQFIRLNYDIAQVFTYHKHDDSIESKYLSVVGKEQAFSIKSILRDTCHFMRYMFNLIKLDIQQKLSFLMEYKTICFGQWQWQTNSALLSSEATAQCKLTAKELLVLKSLILNENRIMTREMLLYYCRLLNEDISINERAIDVIICRLRAKLSTDKINYIRSVRNKGYFFALPTLKWL